MYKCTHCGKKESSKINLKCVMCYSSEAARNDSPTPIYSTPLYIVDTDSSCQSSYNRSSDDCSSPSSDSGSCSSQSTD